MTRLSAQILGLIFLLAAVSPLVAQQTPKPPNIIYILADDLGYGEVGCYGQTKIRTPNIDRLAREGMRFTQHYSGSPVCAPSRCTLLTGLHTGHAYIRNNKEMGGWERGAKEGQLPLPEGTVTIAHLLQARGYATGAIGKWGLGGPGSTGHPNRQGFDHWYGYLCQRVAHNYYPTHLWRNDEKHVLDNEWFKSHQRLESVPDTIAAYDRYRGTQYAPDLMIDEAITFVRANRARPFFLLFATPVPHAAIQVPEDAQAEYANAFPETPYIGTKGYLPHPAPRAGYAAMVSRMDRDVGRLLDLLTDLGLAENTIVMFSSDNGPTYNGGTDSTFFESTGGFRGLKGSLYEGGIRVPFIARWPGRIAAGAISNHISAFWDIMPTLCEASGAEIPAGIDGISIIPTLLGERGQERHQYLYWEHGGKQAVRLGAWKAVRLKDQEHTELYELRLDRTESENIADGHAAVTAHLEKIMETARTESEHFSLSR